MQIEAIGFVTLALGVVGLLAGPIFLTYVFLASTLLGAAAAVILTSLGFATIGPADVLLGFITLSVLLRHGAARAAARSLGFPNEGFWLLLTAAYVVMSAILLPRIFAGATYVFAVARTEIGPGIVSMPLAPVSGNITQPIYFLGDVACFLVFYALASRPDSMKAVADAMIVCAGLNLCFVLLDVVTYATHTGYLLSVIRNASYRMLDDATVVGLKRIVGSYPEASTFAYFTLGWFAFCASLWLGGIRARITGPMALLSLTALLLSTSSTGYTGAAAFVAALFLACLAQVVMRPVSRQRMGFIVAAPLLAVALLMGLRLHPPTWMSIERMVDASIVDKLSSASGIEREKWTQQALMNFADTDWLGAGTGSVRASSFPVAVLGNIGAIGAATYGGFLLLLLFDRRHRWKAGFPACCQSAARWACFAQLAAASVSGSFIDLGLPFFAFAGLACAAPEPLRHLQHRPAPTAASPPAEPVLSQDLT